MKYINKSINKLDSESLLKGKPLYTEDIAEENALIVKVLRSPYAHAIIKEINKDIALKVPNIECILTYEDVPKKRFTIAGQSYPETSPYDRLILDKKVRYVGDPVCIVAGSNEKAVDKALKLIKVKYDVLDSIIDFRDAKDNKVIIHDEDDYTYKLDLGIDRMRNICSSGGFTKGDVLEEFKNCDVIVNETYNTKANAQAMMETHRTFTSLDCFGRLNIVSSTQVPFHVRRIVATALDIDKSKVRVIKPRIGGGFGAKQTLATEIFPSLVTMVTGKSAKYIFTREEAFTGSSSRHQMEIKVKIGATKDGEIKAIQIYTLSNTGAYGEHGAVTVELSGYKTMPLYNRAKALKFDFDVVYTNTMAAGAFRGFGATQGTFAIESAVNELAAKLNMDPTELRLKNMVTQGEVMDAYYGETLNSCTLDKCLLKGKELIKWDEKYQRVSIDSKKVRAVGCAMTMQGSGISSIDTASVEVKLIDDGNYLLLVGSTDMGTGSDTILAQMVAECMDCDIEKISVHGVDTDTSPYDTGSYASSTTYVTGMAAIKTCESLKDIILDEASRVLKCNKEELEFLGDKVKSYDNLKEISLKDLANDSLVGEGRPLSAKNSHSSKVSPPPFMVGFAEVEVDKELGTVELINYVGVVDCGTVINKNLAKVQTEGGIAQGIGMALFEDINYDKRGKMINNSFMQYKIPSRLDVSNIIVDFEESFEKTGPFGAKSIGEVVINTPAPAIANAIYNAVSVNIRSLPITPEKIFMEMNKK
ncbi:MAG: xanthine dehydrogenase family protein molybdopterin-binding subunit [Clostridium chrysemydis]|uniref:xanthine dehydrogenase family protein molybdopterin-binding subunit n=1 Tax=Clostridium chrysemydis TaxID=2665504 RepID=UPI003F366F05